MAALDLSSMHDQRVQFLVPHNGMTSAEPLDAEDVGFTLQEGRLLHMSSAVDMENTVTVGCAGAVLAYLQRRRATEPSLGDRSSEAFRVKSVEMFGLKGTM
jgi:DNA mismatch repair protein MSH5